LRRRLQVVRADPRLVAFIEPSAPFTKRFFIEIPLGAQGITCKCVGAHTRARTSRISERERGVSTLFTAEDQVSAKSAMLLNCVGRLIRIISRGTRYEDSSRNEAGPLGRGRWSDRFCDHRFLVGWMGYGRHGGSGGDTTRQYCRRSGSRTRVR